MVLLKQKLCIVLAAILVLPLHGLAAEFDGSKPLACAIIDAIDCAPAEDCTKVSAQALNFPQFLFIDFQKQLISGKRPNSGGRLEAAIKSRTIQDDLMILQGAQNGRGWSLTVEKQTGRMSATVAGLNEGFVLFGACISKIK